MLIYKPSLRATLQAMEPRQVECIPFGMFAYATLRNTASIYGMESGRKYKVQIDRKQELYTITRER